MHLLVPFAAPLTADGRQALRDLALPNLAALWPMLAETARDAGDETTLSPPHERALARALELPVIDGLLPLAAVEAARAGLPPAEAWACLTPAHWQLGAEHVLLSDPAALGLDEAASRELLEAVRELFESEGVALHYAAPTRWLAAHPSFAELPSASLDRAVGRSVEAWFGADRRGRLIRRLQNELQMLLHLHPINAGREARGELPVNSVWVSGTGAAAPAHWPAGLQIDDRLRAPAWSGDWFAWSRAWQALDAGAIAAALGGARRGEPVTLTLCGERAALTLQARPLGLWQRVAARLRAPDLVAVLEGL